MILINGETVSGKREQIKTDKQNNITLSPEGRMQTRYLINNSGGQNNVKKSIYFNCNKTIYGAMSFVNRNDNAEH